MVWGMSDRPLPGARRFETFVRWSTYSAVALPVATFLGSALVVQGPIGSGVAVQAGVFGLALALTAGNVLVSRRSIDTVVGRAGRLPVGLLAGWALVLVALVVVAPMTPLPAMQLTAVAAVASVAAGFGQIVECRRRRRRCALVCSRLRRRRITCPERGPRATGRGGRSVR